MSLPTINLILVSSPTLAVAGTNSRANYIVKQRTQYRSPIIGSEIALTAARNSALAGHVPPGLIPFCEKLKPLRFKLIFSMTQVTQSTNPSTMCTNTLKTKKLQLPNHVRFTSLFEKPLASLGQSALLLGTHGAVSYPDLRSAARTKHKARPV